MPARLWRQCAQVLDAAFLLAPFTSWLHSHGGKSVAATWRGGREGRTARVVEAHQESAILVDDSLGPCGRCGFAPKSLYNRVSIGLLPGVLWVANRRDLAFLPI